MALRPKDPPLRLVLGADGVEGIRTKYAELTAELRGGRGSHVRSPAQNGSTTRGSHESPAVQHEHGAGGASLAAATRRRAAAEGQPRPHLEQNLDIFDFEISGDDMRTLAG